MTTYDFAAARNAKKPEPGGASNAGIRILIADPHRVMREALRALLSTQPDFQVVGASGDRAEILRCVGELAPDLVLLDVSMPGARGLEVLRDLRTAASGTRTVVLTSALDRAEALNVLRLGAQGLILRSAPAELICKCIRRVHCGEWWFSRELIAAAVESLPPTAAEEPRPTSPQIRLTRREREITRYIVGGDTNQAIARRLSVGEDTVKHHLTSIFQKTGVSTRVELALFAIQHGLVKT